MGVIDNYASPDNPVVDITGTPLGVQVLFADKGSPTRTAHALAPYEAALGLSGGFLASLLTPLSQFFDQVWSQTKDSKGKTMRNRVKDQVSSGITTQVNSQFPGHPPYNIFVSLPETGILRALVVSGPSVVSGGTLIYLSYEINGNSASWSLHNTQVWPLLPSDAGYTLTFDLELFIQIIIPAQVNNPLTTVALAFVENSNISGANTSAQIADFVGGLINFINGQPFNIFQAAEGSIDSEGSGVAVNLGGVSTLLAGIPTAWQQALPYGFTQLTALIQQQQLLPAVRAPSGPSAGRLQRGPVGRPRPDPCADHHRPGSQRGPVSQRLRGELPARPGSCAVYRMVRHHLGDHNRVGSQLGTRRRSDATGHHPAQR